MKYVLVPLFVAAALICAPTAAAADNYVTQSGRVLCAVTPDSTIADTGTGAVVCQGAFTQSGAKFQAVTTGDGSFYWQDANLAVDNPTTTMEFGMTYHGGSWTIYADQSGTRFTPTLRTNVDG